MKSCLAASKTVCLALVTAFIRLSVLPTLELLSRIIAVHQSPKQTVTDDC
jgi:hypothetical protein